MNMIEWAKKEVELAIANKKQIRECGYINVCYTSALKAFESLCNDGHSGMSIHITTNILNQLLDGKPLTPIEDTGDSLWNFSFNCDDGIEVYQCTRMSSLFKNIHPDGSVTYEDINQCYCADINYPSTTYHLELVNQIINDLYPISMPYLPGTAIKVFTEDFLTDQRNGDFDTVGVFYGLKNTNRGEERIEINRFFRDPFKDESNTYPGWVEISKEEYDERKKNKVLPKHITTSTEGDI